MNDVRIDFDGIIVTADNAGEAAQPWSDKPCFRYLIRISARDAGQYTTYAYGSQHDYEQGINDRAEEMAWMVLSDLLNAADDAEEFWELAALGEPDNLSIERARNILETIDYAAKISDLLDANREEILDAYETL